MNLTLAQFRERRQQSRLLAVRLLAATLSLFVLSAVPALAEPVRINQVVQTLSSSKGTLDIRLTTLASQDPGSPTKGSTQQSGPRNDNASPGGAKPDSIISTITITSEGQQLGVDISEEGEVDGTICDCGEILIAGGGIPKWPFLFLAAVPLVFINDCDTCTEPPSSLPTPTPPSLASPSPTPTPEPASLLLFGTGLLAAGAGLRRHYAKTKQLKRQEEE